MKPCICIYATNGKRKARILWQPGCPAHPGAPERLSDRLLEVPEWMGEW